MPTSATPDDLREEMQAILAARQEVGSSYDDAFIDAPAQKLHEGVLQRPRTSVRSPLHEAYRLAMAAISVIAFSMLAGITILVGPSMMSVILLTVVAAALLCLNIVLDRSFK